MGPCPACEYDRKMAEASKPLELPADFAPTAPRAPEPERSAYRAFGTEPRGCPTPGACSCPPSAAATLSPTDEKAAIAMYQRLKPSADATAGEDDALSARQFAEGCRRQAAYWNQRDPSEAYWFVDLAELLDRLAVARSTPPAACAECAVLRGIMEREARNLSDYANEVSSKMTEAVLRAAAKRLRIEVGHE